MFDLNITHEVNGLSKIERDLSNSTITTRLHYNGKEHKKIRLADILSLA